MSTKDFRLNENNDICFTPQNDFCFISGVDGVLQSVENILKIAVNEWFLNTTLGVEWFEILGEKIDEEEIQLIITQAILQEKQVSNVTNIKVKFDTVKRKIQIEADIEIRLLDENRTINMEVTF